MKRLLATFALVAMIPASLNATVPVSGGTMTLLLCTGAGPGGTVTVPVKPAAPFQRDTQSCCAKGCHGGSSRKKLVRKTL